MLYTKAFFSFLSCSVYIDMEVFVCTYARLCFLREKMIH